MEGSNKIIPVLYLAKDDRVKALLTLRHAGYKWGGSTMTDADIKEAGNMPNTYKHIFLTPGYVIGGKSFLFMSSEREFIRLLKNEGTIVNSLTHFMAFAAKHKEQING